MKIGVAPPTPACAPAAAASAAGVSFRGLEIGSQLLYVGLMVPYHLYLGWRLSRRSSRVPTSLVLLGIPEFLLWAFAGPQGGKEGGKPHPEYAASVQVIRSVILASTFIAGLNFKTAMDSIQDLEEDLKKEERGLLSSWHAQRMLFLSVLLFAAFTLLGITIWAALNSSWLLGTALYRVDVAQAEADTGRVPVVQAVGQVIRGETGNGGGTGSTRGRRSEDEVNGSTQPQQHFSQPYPHHRPQPHHSRMPAEQALGAARVDNSQHARLLAESACVEERLDRADEYTAQLMAQVSLMHLSFGAAFRCFYAAIPVALAAAGPVVFIVATVCQLALLAYVDHSGPAPTSGMLDKARRREERKKGNASCWPTLRRKAQGGASATTGSGKPSASPSTGTYHCCDACDTYTALAGHARAGPCITEPMRGGRAGAGQDTAEGQGGDEEEGGHAVWAEEDAGDD